MMKTRIIRPRQNRVRKTSEVKFENKGIQTSPYIYAQLPEPLRPQASKEERPKDLVSLYHHPLYSHQLRVGNVINRPKVRTYSDHNHIVTYLEGLGEHNITFYVNNRHTSPSRIIQGANGTAVILKKKNIKSLH